MDFTLDIYVDLLLSLQSTDYEFQTFEAFIKSKGEKAVVLRHDVDRLTPSTVRMSRIESMLGIKASYHFRIGIAKKNPECLKEIIKSGHEIAYHYEDLSRFVGRKGINDEVKNKAWNSFRRNLEFLRSYYPVKVISMHGDPLSPVDNRKMWEYFSYREEGILCEPYLDIDYSEVIYLTDTGRRWNGDRSNLRDKTESQFSITGSESLSSLYAFRSTQNIIDSIKGGLVSTRMILNTHPQRWTANFIPWAMELVWQNLKNLIKYLLILSRRQQNYN
jgi:hypothetical protein